MRTLTHSSQERLREQLAELSAEQLVELLDAKALESIQRQFVSRLDADDMESIVFAGVDAHEGHDRAKMFERMHRLWVAYLDALDLLNDSVLGPAIEQAYLDANDEEV